VTKSELVAGLRADYPHLRQEDVELIVATIFDQIAGALARGDRVELRGFGAFTVKQRKARTGRNPRTGERVPVSEKVFPYFRTSGVLHRRLNRPAAQGGAGRLPKPAQSGQRDVASASAASTAKR
jgi:integration host factor subunit beta